MLQGEQNSQIFSPSGDSSSCWLPFNLFLAPELVPLLASSRLRVAPAAGDIFRCWVPNGCRVGGGVGKGVKSAGDGSAVKGGSMFDGGLSMRPPVIAVRGDESTGREPWAVERMLDPLG